MVFVAVAEEEEVEVPREGEMLPQVGAVPDARHVPVGPYGVALPEVADGIAHGPDIGVVAHAPAARSPESLRSDSARLCKVADE